MKGLRLFARTSCPHSINLASYHSPHSLTWSWILSVAFDGIWKHHDKPKLRMGFHPYRTNGGLQIVLTIPGFVFQWHRQREMWFRDLRQRERHERDAQVRVRRQVQADLAASAIAKAEPTSRALH